MINVNLYGTLFVMAFITILTLKHMYPHVICF